MSDIEIRKKYIVDKEALPENLFNAGEDFGKSEENVTEKELLDSPTPIQSNASNGNNFTRFPSKRVSWDDWPRTRGAPGWSGTGLMGNSVVRGGADRLIPSFSARKIRQILMASRRSAVEALHSTEPSLAMSNSARNASTESRSVCASSFSSPMSQENSFTTTGTSYGGANHFRDSDGSSNTRKEGGETRSVHFDKNYNINLPFDELCESPKMSDKANNQHSSVNHSGWSSNSSISSYSGGNRDKLRRTRTKEADDAARISLSRLFVSQGQFHLDILKEEIHLMEQLEQGVLLFNNSPEEGILYMIEHRLIENDPSYIANFLLHTDFLDKRKVGELLGGHSNFSISILNNYVRLFNTNSLEPDVALRYFLSRFFLPGESQMVYRILERFSVSYVKDNQDGNGGGLFSNCCTPDHIHTLFYALVMLNTSLHNPHVRKKMSKGEFTSMCILSGMPFATQQLELMYDRVLENELKPFLSPYEQVYGRLSRDPKVLRSKEVSAVNLSLLQKGSVFRKFHSKRRSHTIIAWISQDSGLFCWKRVRRKDSDALLNPGLLVSYLTPQVDKLISKNKKYLREANSQWSGSGAEKKKLPCSESKRGCILTNRTGISGKLRKVLGLDIFDLSCVLLKDIVDLNMGISGNSSSPIYHNSLERKIIRGSTGKGGAKDGKGDVESGGETGRFKGLFWKKRAKRRVKMVSALSTKTNRTHYYSSLSSHKGGGGVGGSARSISSRLRDSELESRCFSLFTKRGERIDLCSLDSTHPSILTWVRFFHQTIVKNQEALQMTSHGSSRGGGHLKSAGGTVISDNYFDQDKGIESDLLKVWYHGIFLQWENHWSFNSHIISLPTSKVPKKLSSIGHGATAGGNGGAIIGSSSQHGVSESGHLSYQSGNFCIYSPKNLAKCADEHLSKALPYNCPSAELEHEQGLEGANCCFYNMTDKNAYAVDTEGDASGGTKDGRFHDNSKNSSSAWVRNSRNNKDVNSREKEPKTKNRLLVLGLGEDKPKRRCFSGRLSHLKNGIISRFSGKQNVFSKLTSYQAPISHPILHLWSNNIPYSYRGILWNVAVGNQLRINKDIFLDLLKMRRRFLQIKDKHSSPSPKTSSNNSSQKCKDCDSPTLKNGPVAANDTLGTGGCCLLHAPCVGRGGPLREAFMVHLKRFHKDVANVFPEFHSYFIGAGAVLGCKIWDRSRNGLHSLDSEAERVERREDVRGTMNVATHSEIVTCIGSEASGDGNGNGRELGNEDSLGNDATTITAVRETVAPEIERRCSEECSLDNKKCALYDSNSLNESSTGSACFSSRQSPFLSPLLMLSPSGKDGACDSEATQHRLDGSKSFKNPLNDNYCYYNYYNRDTDVGEVELESEVDSVFLFMNDNQETRKVYEGTRILVECFMLYRPDIGYVEGMSHIAVILLLFNIDLLEAFKTFTNLLHSCYFLDLFLLNHRNVKMRLDFFDSLLRELIPSLYHHFDLLSITSDTYLMTWFTSLFSVCLPIQIVPRVWDSIFLLGEPYAFQVAAAILKYHEHKLIMTSFEGCISILHGVPSRFDFRRFSSALEQFSGIISGRFGQWLAAQRLSEQKADLFEELL